MYHSITIGEKNTWDDWHLIPTSRPLFNPPSVKTNYVSVPGGDGELDLTDTLAGRPTYGNRTGSWEFIVQNGFKPWNELFTEIMTYLHGQRYIAILEDDPMYYYEGRFTINQWKSEQQWSKIVIDYNAEPYKREVSGLGTDWLWDTFNFQTGVIRNYRNLSVVGSLTVEVPGGMVDSIPIIFSSVMGMKVHYNGNTYELAKGANSIPSIILHSENNTLTFEGTGMISIENIGGLL